MKTAILGLVFLVVGCTNTILEEPRVQLAKACEVYAATVNTLTKAVEEDRLNNKELNLFEFALDSVTPLCADQSTVDAGIALDQVEHWVSRLENILRGG